MQQQEFSENQNTITTDDCGDEDEGEIDLS
jgi:hypothetical protein